MKRASLSVTVIIPCFNDYLTIGSIVSETRKATEVKEIIVVDDGSDEETKKVLREIEGVELFSHRKNLGKAAAMKTGLLQARFETIIFIDADLVGFRKTHINQMIKKFIDGNYDMVIGDREIEFWWTKVFYGVLVYGERIVKKDLLLRHLDIFNAQGYLIEAALNRVFFKKYKVGQVLLKGLGQRLKSEKFGKARGNLLDQKMWFSIIKYLGPREFLFQVSYANRLT